MWVGEAHQTSTPWHISGLTYMSRRSTRLWIDIDTARRTKYYMASLMKARHVRRKSALRLFSRDDKAEKHLLCPWTIEVINQQSWLLGARFYVTCEHLRMARSHQTHWHNKEINSTLWIRRQTHILLEVHQRTRCRIQTVRKLWIWTTSVEPNIFRGTL